MLVTDYLRISAERYSHKKAFVDDKRAITYQELNIEASHLATVLASQCYFRRPIAIFLDKSVECVAAFLGTALSGNFYTPLDTNMPMARIQKIIDTLMPAVVITDEAHSESVKGFAGDAPIILYEQAQKRPIDEALISRVNQRIVDTDVLYVLFTSGSTGVPKGVTISHAAVVDFTEWGTSYFGIDESYVFGNQTPFYFSMSVFDIYQTLRNAATLYIIPRQAFSFPTMLMQYLLKNDINSLFWVPSALCMISALNALDSPHLPALRNVLFGGEVMPMKQLNKWIATYPGVRFVNMYGPTEVTDTCTCYVVDRAFAGTERLPMGKPCRNMDVFLLDEQDHLVVEDGGIGEVCVRGVGLAYGYYNDPQKTKETFVQNPCNQAYPEKIYRTGDLAQYNKRGELVYISRKDFQIKHMGHRIELGEIETALTSIDGVESGVCLYDSGRSRIVMFYAGSAEGQAVIKSLKKLVPEYMVPGKHVHMETMPLNLNGKIDRQMLKEQL